MSTQKTDRELKSFNNYLQNGLTYISDNTSIHPRDEAGNIIFNEGATDNPILIVEPVKPLYTVESVINAVKTNFEYFKFPISITTLDDTETLEQFNEEFENQLPENDIIYARYKPSEDYIIPYGDRYIGIEFSEVYEGAPQLSKNFYVITKEIKESGKDLRFRIKITHRAVTPIDVNPNNSANWPAGGEIYWSVNKQGPDLPTIRAYGDGQGSYRSWASSGKSSKYGSITLEDGELTAWNDFVIKNNTFEVGEQFNISVYTGNKDGHQIVSARSYWVITDASKNVDIWNREI
jgi:hypothetical protein